MGGSVSASMSEPRIRRISGRTANSSTRSVTRINTPISAKRMMSSREKSNMEVGSVARSAMLTGPSANCRLTTCTWSPRLSSKPMAVRTSAVIWSSSGCGRGA